MRLLAPARVVVLSAALAGTAAGFLTAGVLHAYGRPAPAAAAVVSLPAVAQVAYRPGDTGFDVSWPQCGGPLPDRGPGIAVVGVNGGQPFTGNPCFGVEWAWAVSSPSASVYLNLDRRAPDLAAHGGTGPRAACAGRDAACASYDEGWSAALDAVDRVAAARANPVMWWLDVETAEDWSCDPGCDTRANAALIQGAVDLLRSRRLQVGVYSNRWQWAALVGGYAPGLPVWTTDYDDPHPEAHRGDADAFGGGQVHLVQTRPTAYDGDYACRTQLR